MAGVQFDGLEQGLGVGQGGNQVYNTSGNIALFANILKQQQAQRQQEQQVLANELAQVKVDGLREPDKPEFFNKYQELKSTASKIPYERDSWKRAQMKADVDKRILELQTYASNSKKYGSQYTDFQKQLLDDRIRHQFSDDAVMNVQNSNKLSINDPNFIRDFTGLERAVDGEKIDKMVSQLDSQLLKKSQWGTPVQTKGSQGNKSGVMFYNNREVSPQEQLTAYGLTYDADRNFKKFITDQYKDVFASNDEQTAKALALKDYADRRRQQGTLSESTAPQFRQDWRPRVTVNVDNGSAGIPKDTTIPFGGTGNVLVKNFVGLSIPNKNFAGTPAIDLENGKPIPALESSGSYSIVGVGNWPVIIKNATDGKGNSIKGAIAQPNWVKNHPDAVEYRPYLQVEGKDDQGYALKRLIEYDKIPENIRNSKSVSKALSNFSPASGQVQSPSKVPLAQPAKKTIKSGDVASRAQASGYSVKEYTKLLKANGITIE